jgi:O-methyltransferase involved in polyketide biosynthesis
MTDFNGIILESKARGIEGYYTRNKEAALAKAMELVSSSSTIFCGGSTTIEEIGLMEELSKRDDVEVWNPKAADGTRNMNKIAHKALGADVFLMSSNAILPKGTVINLGAGLDDTFSRVDNGRVSWYNLDLPDASACR